MVRKTIYIITFALLSIACHGQNEFKDIHFSSPVKIPLLLSGNFGEIRSQHYHFGIDIKTQGRKRVKLYAPANGYISRIYENPFGYGKALLITHHNGYKTVYAHMDDFPPYVMDYVRDYQYKHETYTFDIFPGPSLFPVKEGDFIGYTGNSGLSLGPHLHYEIRDVRNERPVNVLLFNMDVKDDIPPKIYHLGVYPLDTNSFVEKKHEKYIVKTIKTGQKYTPEGKDTIKVMGTIGLAFETYDFLNNTSNICGIYTAKVYLDGDLIYSHEMKELDFSEIRYVNSHIDYEEKLKTRRDMQKTFIDPNNKSSIFKHVKNRGHIELNDDKVHEVIIELRDVYQNESILEFYLQNEDDPTLKAPSIDFAKYMPYNTENTFQKHDIKVYIPKDALYRDLQFRYLKTEGIENSYSPVYHVDDKYTPLHKSMTLSIKPENLPAKYQDKALLARIDDDNRLEAEGGDWNNGFVTLRTRKLGKYTVTVDTVPPKIVPVNIAPGKNMQGQSMIKLQISDDFSGIKSYNGYIDNKWALFEYEPKQKLLFYQFDEDKLVKNKHHELEVYVVDGKSNLKSYIITFFW